MASYNLIDEPWIPCVQKNGQFREYGLLDTLLRAHEFEDVQDTSPLVIVSLYRLLLAILHRNFGPSNPSEWSALWQSGKWNADTLESYFSTWRSRFDLFDAERPFFQTILTENEKIHPPHLLSLEFAAGNNPTLFDHSSEVLAKPMAPAEAARYLVARQAFSIGFGKSTPFYLSDSSLIRGLSILMKGENLFESLALNLIGYTEHRPIHRRGEDLPCWEQQKQEKPDKEGTIPRGYVDYLTWQSRRIQLIQNETTAEVIGCRITQNLKLPTPTPLDPFKCYADIEKKGLVPKGFREDRALWRDSHILFQTRDKSFKRPEVFNWIARLRVQQIKGLDSTYRFRAIGIATDFGKAASVIFWRHENLPLPLQYLNDDDLIASLRDFLEVAEKIGGQLSKVAWLLARLTLFPDETKDPGKEGKKEISDMCEEIAPGRLYWPRLEAPFRRLLEDLPADKSTDDSDMTVYGGESLSAWIEITRRMACGAFDTASLALGESPRALKARAVVNRRFHRNIAEIISNYTEDHEKEEVK